MSPKELDTELLDNTGKTRGYMKAFIPALLFIVLFLAACGDSDPSACRNFCTSMENMPDASCFGSWLCVTDDKRDNYNLCATRDVFSYTLANGSQRYVCTKADAEEAGRASIPDDVSVPETARETLITNPLDGASCLTQCDLLTQGDSLPAQFLDDITSADSCFSSANSFLQAQLNQQCRIEAEEK